MLGTVAGKVAKKSKIPVIMDMAENYPAVMKGWDKYSNSILKRFIFHRLDIPQKTEDISVKLMDGIYFVAEENRNRILDSYNHLKSEVIYNTPKLSDYNFKRFKVEKEFKQISYHGFLNNERNFEIFLDAYNSSKLNLDLELWGDGPSYEKLKANNKSNQVKLYGKYNHPELKEIIKSCDIGILPYKIDNHINNTISNKFFDYMANGIPIICSPAIPMKNIIDKHKLGLYFNLKTKIDVSNMINELSQINLKELGENGYNTFKNIYNWEEDEKKLLKFVKIFI
jgi:glycosyltransferase involved in cell wall biosynthesis